MGSVVVIGSVVIVVIGSVVVMGSAVVIGSVVVIGSIVVMGSAIVEGSAADKGSSVVKGWAVDKGLTVSNNFLGNWPITVNHHGTSHLEQINIMNNTWEGYLKYRNIFSLRTIKFFWSSWETLYHKGIFTVHKC